MDMDSEQMADTTGWDKATTDEKEIVLDTDGVYKVTYYITEWTNPEDDTDIIYELHGNCWAWGVDVSSWTEGSSTLTCNLGFYYDETERVDWTQVNMQYEGADADQTWSCKDGVSTSSSEFTFTEDSTSNCMANTSKSSS